MKLVLLAAVALFAVTGCNTNNQPKNADQIRQDAANAASTAVNDAHTAVNDARAAVQGVKDGVNSARGPLNINTASTSDLMSLPGVDDAIASRIITHRPYDTTAQLVSRKIVSTAEYDQISPKIEAR